MRESADPARNFAYFPVARQSPAERGWAVRRGWLGCAAPFRARTDSGSIDSQRAGPSDRRDLQSKIVYPKLDAAAPAASLQRDFSYWLNHTFAVRSVLF